ncbi:hypothetical protein NT95_05225 [Oenococcus kitaharae]|nr:hypothetical protein NT95_05225 [Oenococcus kitaharae]OEY85316.1 hypothetical protein NT96_01670 [Oenococcus kitaharae]OEY86170.1 hypothetical protein NV75_01620 [Oenococcus kitaharae]
MFPFKASKKVLVVFSLIIGLLVGLIVSVFRLAITYGLQGSLFLYAQAHQNALYWLLILPLLLVIGWILSLLVRQDPNIKGSGIPQVEAQLINRLDIHWLSVLLRKFAAAVLALSTGLMLGREGPSIQLGAALGQGLAENRHASNTEKRILLSAGAAAGLSAAFNAPIAAVLFVVEEMHHNFSPLVWISAFIASLTADFVSLTFFGLRPVLHFDQVAALSLGSYLWLLPMAVVIGLLAVLYQKNTLSLPRLYAKLPIKASFYIFIPLLLSIPVIYFLPEIVGGGNRLILALPAAHLTLIAIALIFVLRYVYSLLTFASGVPGGIFLPILTLGALIGYFFYTLLHQLAVIPAADASVFITIGMAAYFGSISMAPLTAIILVTEMVGSLEHIMPLGLTTLVAYLIVDAFSGKPIYESLMLALLSHQSGKTKTAHRELFEFPIPSDSKLVGQTVSEVVWPEGCLILSIRRGSQSISANGKTSIQANDVLICLVKAGSINQMRQII